MPMPRGIFVVVLLCYFASGISLTLYNKYIVSVTHYGFTYPITLILTHMLFNFALAGLTVRCAPASSHMHASPFHPKHITRSMFMRQFVPIGLLFGADITLTNVSFRFMSVSLTEVIKSSVPALIFLTNLARGVDRTRGVGLRVAKMLNVVLICAGVACSAVGEIDFEIRGFLAAIGATLSATAKLLLIETLLAQETEDVMPRGLPGSDASQIAMAPLAGRRESSGDSSIPVGGDTLPHNGSRSSPHQLLVAPAMHLNARALTPSTSSDELAALQHDGLTKKTRRGNTPVASGSTLSNHSSGGGGPASARNANGSSSGGGSTTYTRVQLTDEDEEQEERLRQLQRHVQHNASSSHIFSPAVSRLKIATSPPPPSVLETLAAPTSTSGPAGSAAGGEPIEVAALAHAHPHVSHRLHPLLSLFYFAPVSALALFPLQLWLEAPELSDSRFITAGHWEPTLGLVLGGGLMAFALNASELFVLRETSALTLCIFGISKFVLIIGLSQATGLQRDFTPLNVVGLTLTVVGLVVYNGVKFLESKQAAQRAAAVAAAAVLAASSPSSAALCRNSDGGGDGNTTAQRRGGVADESSSELRAVLRPPQLSVRSDDELGSMESNGLSPEAQASMQHQQKLAEGSVSARLRSLSAASSPRDSTSLSTRSRTSGSLLLSSPSCAGGPATDAAAAAAMAHLSSRMRDALAASASVEHQQQMQQYAHAAAAEQQLADATPTADDLEELRLLERGSVNSSSGMV